VTLQSRSPEEGATPRAAARLSAESDRRRARLLDGMGQYEAALALYQRILEREPRDLMAHRDYNHLLYRLGRNDRFLLSYDEAAARSSAPLALRRDKAWFLLSAERFAEAHALYAQVLAAAPADVIAATGVGVALEKMGELEPALAAYRAALSCHPKDVNLYSSIASTLLKLQDPLQAAELAQRGLEIAPTDQLCLATLSIAWRLRGDAREEWLCRYDDFIRVFDLEPPEGFASMSRFNEELNAFLDQYHHQTGEFLNQSLRGGTQTPQDLFDSGHHLIDLLQQQIDKAICQYIAALPDERHPFTGRRAPGFIYTGSWSSRLYDGGFHADHVHPRGWISSCYYVALPGVISDESGHGGWLKFGQPSHDFGLEKPIRRVIQPQSGQLVLFPSYLWHGTIPFHQPASTRTTIAFDLTPAAG
jgi:tetratricopeptide (TPR) repeat protein